ncbi:nitrate reductase molybdenum cofactor assembly chaperone [Lentibacillus sp. CBA3610]|uniref:nitrate reductase molybdenum cofactor assembly chaperone n=1 Tax=Lentibacillus sp. CBA3610 TaxID=2518176 RepID=UPI00159505E5|nr:nitrate reductase molybdenum cofactor assembly chaperone [Lentibacillus sp. CBA3610]QKY69150.1 nitrate reductase molybdenum cofactor assembly chaperone [Lentibacillus sp. CBA3610]
MDSQERTLLVIGSRLLAYPEDDFRGDLRDINDSIEDNMTTSRLRDRLKSIVSIFNLFSLQDLREMYVSTFDLRAKNGLYLTAHELGDSSKRGAALIRLQNIIKQAGYERIDDDLADYIPMLFEFLAVAPESQDNERLIKRLAVAVQRIMKNLPDENPYYNLLQLLMEVVFPEPTKKEIAKLEFEREEADLEELPFPIMYG